MRATSGSKHPLRLRLRAGINPSRNAPAEVSLGLVGRKRKTAYNKKVDRMCSKQLSYSAEVDRVNALIKKFGDLTRSGSANPSR